MTLDIREVDRDPREPAFRIVIDRSPYASRSDEVRFTLDCVLWDPLKREVTNPHDPAFDGLQLQANGSFWSDERGRTVYGGAPEYREVYSVNLSRAEAMVATLRKIQKHRDKLATRFGYERDFCDMVARTCDALGIKHIIRDAGRQEVFPSGYRYERVDVGAGTSYLARQVDLYIEDGLTPAAREDKRKADAKLAQAQ